MKRSLFLSAGMALAILLTGCVREDAYEIMSAPQTVPSASVTTAPVQHIQPQSQSGKLLQKIWDAYPAQERFAVFGGFEEAPVEGGPGDLAIEDAWRLNQRYQIPQAFAPLLQDGASLVHMLNSTLFTSAAFTLTQEDAMEALAEETAEALQKIKWVCGMPDKILLVQVENVLIMAYGVTDLLDQFQDSLWEVYPQGKLLIYETVMG